MLKQLRDVGQKYVKVESTGNVASLRVKIYAEALARLTNRGEAPALKDAGEEIRRGLRNPMGSPPFLEMVKPKDRVVILGDDITRPTPQDLIIPVLLNELNAAMHKSFYFSFYRMRIMPKSAQMLGSIAASGNPFMVMLKFRQFLIF